MSEPPAPPWVEDIEEFWSEPPPEPSARLLYWQAQIADGWQPNRRVATFGYHNAADFFGVYIWEYLNVLYPLLYPPPRVLQ